jgi:hypothetical protein
MNDQDVTFEALREAWDALYDSLPARWHIGRPTYDARGAGWSVTGWGPSNGGGDAPHTMTGTGNTEVAALRDLDKRFGGVPRPNLSRMDEFRHQLRKAYVDGAEAFSRETLERGLTTNELGRIIQRYEGR